PYEGFFTWITTADHWQALEGDGAFYATQSAYAYWKLTGDASMLEQWYPTLANACRFMEECCFDETYGLYEEWYINEASLKKSPIWEGQYPGMKINGKWPEYICSIYLNSVMYSTHVMQAEIAQAIGNTSEYGRHLKAANDLAANMDRQLWNEETGDYTTGIAVLEDGTTATVDTEYWTIWFDNVWGFGTFPMAPDTQKRLMSLDILLNRRDGIFPGYDKRFFFTPMRAHAAYVYNASGQPEKSLVCTQRLFERAEDVDTSEGVKKVYAMKGAMVEMMHMVTEHRPQTFTIGPYLAGAAGLGFIMDYNGLTAVPTDFVSEAKNIAFRDSIWNFDLLCAGHANGVVVDGKKVRHSMKVPAKLMTDGEHNVVVLDEAEAASPVLRYTPFELVDLNVKKDQVVYRLSGFGGGVVRFDDLAEEDVEVLDADGKPMEFKLWSADGGSRVQVNAAGEFTVVVKR
ncbi:MAG: trehalase family glycosidase, partial [Verrucomicrobiota bacterium]